MRSKNEPLSSSKLAYMLHRAASERAQRPAARAKTLMCVEEIRGHFFQLLGSV
jgi:hypothetical protein